MAEDRKTAEKAHKLPDDKAPDQPDVAGTAESVPEGDENVKVELPEGADRISVATGVFKPGDKVSPSDAELIASALPGVPEDEQEKAD